MTTTTIDFCRNLAARIPDIQTILNEHIGDYDDVLPHVFMGDVTRYVLRDGPSRLDVVKSLETAFSKQDHDVEELIAVSFVENLETEEQLRTVIRDVEAPNLVAEWRRQKTR